MDWPHGSVFFFVSRKDADLTVRKWQHAIKVDVEWSNVYWIRLLFILTLVHITLETNPYMAILDSQLDFLFKNIAGFKKKIKKI